MDLITLTIITISIIGSLLLGMAVLIKIMLFGKLLDIQNQISSMRIDLDGLDSLTSKEIRSLDVRMTRLETEHTMTKERCMKHTEDTLHG